MYTLELFSLLLLSLLGLYIGSDVIIKAGKKILGQGFILGLFSAIPELIIISALLFSKKYYLAISSLFTTALTIYSIGISVVSISTFVKWRKNKITVSEFNVDEKPILFAIIGILISTFITREINIFIGIFSTLIFIYYLLKKISNVRVNIKDLGTFIIGMVILWLSSEAFVNSSFNLFPQWIFTVFFFPIILNIQDLIVAVKGSLNSPEMSSQMVLSFIVESIVINSFTFSIIGFLSISSIITVLAYPLFSLLVANLLVLFLLNHNNISLKESMVLLSMYSLVPLSATIHI